MKKILLLATSHDIQRAERLQDEYIEKLVTLKRQYDIKSIAEEADDTDKYAITKSFCDNEELSYINIEPNNNKKVELGIETLDKINQDMVFKYCFAENPTEAPRVENWPKHEDISTLDEDIKKDYYNRFYKHCRKREKAWLDEILEQNIYPCLVIFGANHLKEFSLLLK